MSPYIHIMFQTYQNGFCLFQSKNKTTRYLCRSNSTQIHTQHRSFLAYQSIRVSWFFPEKTISVPPPPIYTWVAELIVSVNFLKNIAHDKKSQSMNAHLNNIRISKNFVNIMICYLLLPLQAGPVIGDQFLFGWWRQNCYHYQNKPAQISIKAIRQESEISLLLLQICNIPQTKVYDHRVTCKNDRYKSKSFLPFFSVQQFF